MTTRQKTETKNNGSGQNRQKEWTVLILERSIKEQAIKEGASWELQELQAIC